MTDRLLTDDALAGIAARAEAWRKNQSLWGPVETELTRDIMVNLDIPALLAHIRAQDAALARLRADLAIIEQGCNSPWMTGAAFKDRVADLFAARRRVLAGDKTDEGE